MSIRQFKWIGTLEAISFILLLGLAMPLKYIWGYPQVVSVVGMAHGVLFILYVYSSFAMRSKLAWSAGTLAVVLVCAFLPFGPFYAERKYLS